MANLYRSFMGCICAKYDHRFSEEMIDFPTVQDGAEGVRFIHACMKSQAEGNVWVQL